MHKSVRSDLSKMVVKGSKNMVIPHNETLFNDASAEDTAGEEIHMPDILKPNNYENDGLHTLEIKTK